MVIIKSPRLTALLVATVLVTLLGSPSDTRAQAPIRSPHGLIQIGGDNWENPVIDGMRVQINWADIQPESDTQYDWSTIDEQVANAQIYQKQLGLSVVLLSAAPQWLTDTPGVNIYWAPSQNGPPTPLVLPWDPVVQAKVINFVTELCQRYDGAVDYIVMGGLGVTTDTYMPDPDQIGLDMRLGDVIAAWIDSSNNIVDAYGNNLHSTPFILATAIPFSGEDAPTALNEMVIRAATMYGQHFGTMHSGLTAQSTSADLCNSLVADFSPRNPAGFQFLCPVAGDANGQTLDGTLDETLNAARILGAQWLEIYSDDAQNPDNATVFEDIKAELAAPPPATKAPPTEVPRGVFSLGNSDKAWQQEALDSPNVTGMSLRYSWAALEPTEGIFNWTFLDSEVARATAAGKQVLLRIGTQSGKPAWVTTAIQRARGKFFTWDNNGVMTTIPVFWDPTFLAKKKAMIAALGSHFTNNPTVTIVCASFANSTSEDWNVPHTATDIANWFAVGYTSDKMLDAGKQIIDATMAAFPNQYVTMAINGNGHVGATGNLDPTATYVAENAIATARASWPGRLIVQVNSLSTFNPKAPGSLDSVWNVLWNSQPDIGAQMVYQCLNDPTYRVNNGIPIDPSIALTRSVNKGVSYGTNYIEIYQVDVINLPLVISYARTVLGGL
jgi:hypothetical protein